MILTKEEYEDTYFGLEKPEYGLFEKEPSSDEDFLMNYVTSKLWRMNNLYTIIDKDGKKVPFVMNRAQHTVFSAHLSHPRIIILKSRQLRRKYFLLNQLLRQGLI